MTTFALTILAAADDNTQVAPDEGISAALIIGTLVLVVLVAAAIFLIFARRTKASRGGVEPPEGERHRGEPPFESVDRGG